MVAHLIIWLTVVLLHRILHSISLRHLNLVTVSVLLVGVGEQLGIVKFILKG